MKFALFFGLLHIPFIALATDRMDMTCVTEFPTTTFILRDDGKELHTQVIHHNGAKYMPIFDGLATPQDLGILHERANVLTDLPTNLTFTWPLDKCSVQDEMIQSCFGATAIQEYNGHKVNAWSLSTSWLTEKTPYGKFNSRKVNLNIDVDGKSYSIPMKYAEDECARATSKRR